jgi:cephalosporin hydroxylase
MTMIKKILNVFRPKPLADSVVIKPIAKTRDFDVNTHPQPEADKWTLSEFVVKTLVPIVGVHPYPLDELLLMCSTLNYFRPDLIVEWGTHYGASARVFFEAAQFLSIKTEIHSADLPLDVAHVENLQDQNMRGHLVKGKPVHLHFGDGLVVVQNLMEEKQPRLPLIFLDGDHAYETVQRELNILKEIAPRAVVLAHDTFYQKESSNYNIGPYKAVTEFAEKHSLPTYSTALGLPGMTLLYWGG